MAGTVILLYPYKTTSSVVGLGNSSWLEQLSSFEFSPLYQF